MKSIGIKLTLMLVAMPIFPAKISTNRSSNNKVLTSRKVVTKILINSKDRWRWQIVKIK